MLTQAERDSQRNGEFDALARVALEHARELLPNLLGGRQIGVEWVGARTSTGGPGDSWSINLDSGVWSHFASGLTGTDIIALFAAILHLTQGAAAAEIRHRLGLTRDAPLPRFLPARAPESVPDPDIRIPHDALPLRDHPTHGAPEATYQYGDQFTVCRYLTVDPDGQCGKVFAMWTYGEYGWRARGPSGLRQLYHLEALARHPDATVLVVEGEKCVERAVQGLQGYVAVTWAGGTPAWSKTDWRPLQGRQVLIWPDADEPGRKAAAAIAAHLHDLAASVRVINPNGAADGWDIADAIDQGWEEPRIQEFIGAHLSQAVVRPESEPCILSTNESKAPPYGIESLPSPETHIPSAPVSYEQMGLDCDNNRIPYVTLSNASKILQSYTSFKDRIFFDEFRGQVYHTLRSPIAQPWTDRDTRGVTVAIQQHLKLPKFNLDLIRQGITHAAECNSRHSLKDWLNSLVWDGNSRLETWLADCAGIDLTDYTLAVSRNWPIAMVARAYEPGCKMDNMPVLEGVSGLNKSQFLEILGGEWYEAVPTEFGTKDFLQNIKGVWLAEIPDMTGFNRADHSTVISMLAIRFDKYRKAYGYESERHARTTIFAATSETDDYVADSRGKRRYWPVRCIDIDLSALREQRAQLFAEAVKCYREGAKWFEMPGSALAEQSERVTEDPWVGWILNYVNPEWDRLIRTDMPLRIPMDHILTDGLRLSATQQTVRDARRAGAILRANGWVKKHTNDGNYWRKVERR